jgi:hypothetical protein
MVYRCEHHGPLLFFLVEDEQFNIELSVFYSEPIKCEVKA